MTGNGKKMETSPTKYQYLAKRRSGKVERSERLEPFYPVYDIYFFLSDTLFPNFQAKLDKRDRLDTVFCRPEFGKCKGVVGRFASHWQLLLIGKKWAV